ncbi:hypothetical protein UlMin_035267 [Ulmus minor]
MGAFKAPRLDGMLVLFYKTYWNTVGHDLMAYVREFFMMAYMPKSINVSSIVLIPKKPNLTRLNHFRPISVCNVTYKAYDRLSWDFVKQVLAAFGFSHCWIQWISICLSTVNMKLLINRLLFGDIKPKRGLQKGDPISPYIFILCTEVLSRLLLKKAEGGDIYSFKLTRGGPRLHHLLFTDDVFLFGKACEGKARQFKECLDLFCSWSGLTRWKARLLSKANCLTLIKLVALALPIYAMHSIKVPKTICARMDARIRWFWWGSNDTNPYPLCLKAWDNICVPKANGGLGFRRMANMNLTLLSKWGWDFLTRSSSYCLSFSQSKYLRTEGFWTAKPTHSNSPFWKDVLGSRDLLLKRACLHIGDGSYVNIWEDPWVPNYRDF